MKIYDVTLPLHSGLPVWKGDPPAVIERDSKIADGDLCNSSRINSSLHWGTHMDAPYHLYDDKWTLDQIPIDKLIGPVRVVYFPETPQITAEHLKRVNLTDIHRLFFKTRNSQFWNENPLRFHQDFTALTADAAEYLLQTNVQLIGIDYLSIDLLSAENLPVHRLLYKENVVAIEGLNLSEVPPGDYFAVCLPLRVKQGDGAPIRVILREDGRL